MNAWDVIVAGGGPAGAVCAIELARHGRRVLVLDAESPPRYTIGESLSPTACALLHGYGVSPARLRFVAKPGATFVWGDRAPFATFYPDASAWQVRRADLDEALLDRARVAGATVRTGCQVVSIVFDGDRATGVRFTAEDGEPAEASGTWVVDATGRAAVLARQRELLAVDSGLAHHAVWAHFRGGRRLPGRAAGNSLYIGGTPQWWYLPLDDRIGCFGVGMVLPGPLSTMDRSVNDEAAFAEAVAKAPVIGELVAGATRAGPVRSCDASAYRATSLSGPGWVLAGDAAGFVDPILTPGVQLAIQYGRLVAGTVQAALDDPAHAGPLAREYERRFFRQHATFSALCRNLYDEGSAPPRIPDLAVSPGALAGSGDEQADRTAFMGLIAGLPPPRLGPMLGGYLAARGASVRYGGLAPVFGETEGFAFLSWHIGQRTEACDPAGPRMEIHPAAGAVVVDLSIPPARVGDGPRRVRAARNACGDRFLPTPELVALLTIVAAGGLAVAEAARRFGDAVGAAPDPAAFGRWLALLARNGLVELVAGPDMAATSGRGA